MVTIGLKPDDAPKFCVDNIGRLRDEMIEVASCDKTNTVVYLTEEDGDIHICVYRNDQEIKDRRCPTSTGIGWWLEKIYDDFLLDDEGEEAAAEIVSDPPVPGGMRDDDDDDPEELTEGSLELLNQCFGDEIEEREDTIIFAFMDFLSILTESAVVPRDADEEEELFKHMDRVVRYLATDGGFRIRRPMILQEETRGVHVYSEFPYEQYDFSDDEERNGK